MIDRLVILGSTITALAVARDAHAHGMTPVVLDRDDGIAFRSRYVTASRVAPESGDDLVLSTIGAHVGRASALIATSDAWVRFVARHRGVIDAVFGTVLQPSNAAVEVCLDKRRFSAWCSELGIDSPKAWLAGDGKRPADLDLPLLVRPARTLHGTGGHGLPKAREVRSEAELEALLNLFAAAACPALVSESLLSQDIVQYSVPFARARGKTMSFVARKVRPAASRCSVGTCVELAEQPAVEALVRRAVETLDYFGIGEAEVLHSVRTGRSCLIEINARPWLQYALAPASGHDFLAFLTGRSGPVTKLRKEGKCWIDLPSDLFAALSASEGTVRRGEESLIGYLRSVWRANVYARFDWRDPAPALFGAPRSVHMTEAAAAR